jgi:predicted RNase H-like nuclease (RuvC/YqgF family)
LEFKDE